MVTYVTHSVLGGSLKYLGELVTMAVLSRKVFTI